MAPGLVTPEQRERGKRPTDVMVAHDRLPHRAREDRLPDAEARGARAGASSRPPRGPATCASTRSRARAPRRGRRRARPPLPADRRSLPEAVAVMERGSAIRPRPGTSAPERPLGLAERRRGRAARVVLARDRHASQHARTRPGSTARAPPSAAAAAPAAAASGAASAPNQGDRDRSSSRSGQDIARGQAALPRLEIPLPHRRHLCEQVLGIEVCGSAGSRASRSGPCTAGPSPASTAADPALEVEVALRR